MPGGCYSPLDKSIHAGSVVDIVLDTTGLFLAVFLDKCVESLLATANGDDFGAFEDEFVGKSSSDSSGGPDKEDALVGERHL